VLRRAVIGAGAVALSPALFRHALLHAVVGGFDGGHFVGIGAEQIVVGDRSHVSKTYYRLSDYPSLYVDAVVAMQTEAHEIHEEILGDYWVHTDIHTTHSPILGTLPRLTQMRLYPETINADTLEQRCYPALSRDRHVDFARKVLEASRQSNGLLLDILARGNIFFNYDEGHTMIPRAVDTWLLNGVAQKRTVLRTGQKYGEATLHLLEDWADGRVGVEK
jgi:hypothetical protein